MRQLATGLCLLLVCRVVAAQEPSVSKNFGFDFTPLVGYRTSISLPIQPYVTGTNPRVVLDAGPSYGFAIGARIHDDDVIEFRWARQGSYTRFEDASVVYPRQSATLSQFHGDFTHEYVMEDWGKWARPYVMLSVGATHVSSANSTNFTRFSFGIGGGLKFFLGRHYGFRAQLEWLPVLVEPFGTVICGGGCVVHVGGTLSSQGEATFGPMFRF